MEEMCLKIFLKYYILLPLTPLKELNYLLIDYLPPPLKKNKLLESSHTKTIKSNNLVWGRI